MESHAIRMAKLLFKACVPRLRCASLLSGTIILAMLLHNEMVGVSAQEVAQAQSPAAAELDDATQAKLLRVGIKEAVPFSVRQGDGTWSGISVLLWREIARELDYNYEFQEMSLDEVFDALDAGDIDVGVGALTITPDRERRIDFTHAYFNTGLGIAVSSEHFGGWTAVASRLLSTLFLQVVLGIIALLLVTGSLFYMFERRGSQADLGQGPLTGIGNGIWWAAVTMTTVGYGDRVPRTLGGRLIAMVWMFAALIIIASFTASVTSTLTVARLGSAIAGPRDLYNVRVASVVDSTSEEYLSEAGIGTIRYTELEECLRALTAGKVDAVVYDAPILKHHCLKNYPGQLEVLPMTFEKQNYAFALTNSSDLREPINQVLLDFLGEPLWTETLQRSLGETGL